MGSRLRLLSPQSKEIPSALNALQVVQVSRIYVYRGPLFTGEIKIAANLYYCDDSGACSMGNVDFVIPFKEGSGSGDTSVDVSHMIENFA